MVKVNKQMLDKAMADRGWDFRDLRNRMDVAENTVRNLVNGASLAPATQVALSAAFEDKIKPENLFEVVLEREEPTATGAPAKEVVA